MFFLFSKIASNDILEYLHPEVMPCKVIVGMGSLAFPHEQHSFQDVEVVCILVTLLLGDPQPSASVQLAFLIVP